MDVHLLVLPSKMGIYRKRNVHCIGSSLRYRRGLLRQNPYLRPDIPVSTGLITAKSLSAPRYPSIDGAYYGKIPYLCPDVQRWRV